MLCLSASWVTLIENSSERLHHLVTRSVGEKQWRMAVLPLHSSLGHLSPILDPVLPTNGRSCSSLMCKNTIVQYFVIPRSQNLVTVCKNDDSMTQVKCQISTRLLWKLWHKDLRLFHNVTDTCSVHLSSQLFISAAWNYSFIFCNVLFL